MATSHIEILPYFQQWFMYQWNEAKQKFLANRPMTVQEAGALAKKNPTTAQAKASRANGLLGGRKKGKHATISKQN